jgi:hypothetical protein
VAERIPIETRGGIPRCRSCGAQEGRPGQPDREWCIRCGFVARDPNADPERRERAAAGVRARRAFLAADASGERHDFLGPVVG